MPDVKDPLEFNMRLGFHLNMNSIVFFGSLILAFLFVYGFCRHQFSQQGLTDDGDFSDRLLPRHLATPKEYSSGLAVYFMLMALLVFVASVILATCLVFLKDNAGLEVPAEVSHIGVPLAVTFFLLGDPSHMHAFGFIEELLRKYACKRAHIPDAARAMRDRLANVDFDFARYRDAPLHSAELRGVEADDFMLSHPAIEHSWARLCCLLAVLNSSRIDRLARLLDTRLLQVYENELDLIAGQKQVMEGRVASYRNERRVNPNYTDDGLMRQITKNLDKLYILLGCAVRRKALRDERAESVLRTLGFRIEPIPCQHNWMNVKRVTLAATVAAASILGLDYCAYFIGLFRLWDVSPVYPTTLYQPIMDAAAMLIPYAIAIPLADYLRQHAVNDGSWFSAFGRRRRANGINYICIATACGLAAYVGLILWELNLGPLTLDLFKMDLPSIPLAIVTAAFYLYHVDNAELGRRPSRVQEVCSQGLVTGFFGLAAAYFTFQIALGGVIPADDRIVLNTAIHAAVGCVLAFYIPQAAAARRAATRERKLATESASWNRPR